VKGVKQALVVSPLVFGRNTQAIPIDIRETLDENCNMYRNWISALKKICRLTAALLRT